jgi:hypothetical protein
MYPRRHLLKCAKHLCILGFSGVQRSSSHVQRCPWYSFLASSGFWPRLRNAQHGQPGDARNGDRLDASRHTASPAGLGFLVIPGLEQAYSVVGPKQWIDHALSWVKKGGALMLLGRQADAIACLQRAHNRGGPDAAKVLAAMGVTPQQ